MAADGFLNFNTKIDESGFNSGLSKLASNAAKGIAAVGSAVGGMSVYAIKVGSDFEAAMSRVQAISGATGSELEELTETAKQLGIDTKFSATEAAQAMENLASAGFDTNEIIAATPGMMDLAAAAGEDLANSADIAASTLRGFGLEASEAGHVADVLAENANRTNAAVADTGEAMKYIAPVAHAMGISFEECAAAVGLLANAGIKGGQAGTTLRSALTRLVNPTEEMTETMDALGMSFFDSEGKMLSLSEIIRVLQKSTANLTEEQRNQALATIFGQEALSGMLALIDAGPEQLDELTNAFENCEGAAADTAAVMNDNLQGSFSTLQSSLEALGIEAYEKFEEPLRQACEAGIESVEELTREMKSGKLSKATEKVAEGFGDLIELAADLAAKTIPVLVNALALVIDHGEEIVTIVGMIGAAIVAVKATQTISGWVSAFQTASSAVDAYNVKLLACTMAGQSFNGSLNLMQTAVGLFTGKVNLATAAQTAFQAVSTALGGPVGVAAAAIGALGAGFVALAMNVETANAAHQKNMQAMQDEIDAFEDLKAAQEESLKSNLAEINNLESLNAELQTLVDANGRVKEGYEARANYIVGELNEALGLNMQLTNGEIQGYNELSSSIDTMIAKKRAQIILESQEAAYKEALTNVTEAQIEANKKLDEYNKIKAENDAKIIELEKQKAAATGYAAMSIQDEINSLQYQTITAEAEYNKQQEVVQGYYDAINTYETNATRLASDNAEEIAKIESSVVASKANTTAGKKRELEEQKRNEESYLAYLEETYKNSNDEIELQQIESQKRKIQNIDNELNALTSTVEGEIPTFGGAFRDLMNAGISAASDEAGGFYTVGQEAGQGLKNGLSSTISSIANTAASAVRQAIDAARAEQDSHSPSKEWEKLVGESAGEGMAVGLDNSQKVVNSSVKELVAGAKSQAEKLAKGFQDLLSTGHLESYIADLRSKAQSNAYTFGNVASMPSLSYANSPGQTGPQTIYQIEQSFYNNGTTKPSEAAQEMVDAARRMEWNKK